MQKKNIAAGVLALALAACAPFAPHRVGMAPQDVCPLPQDAASASQACREASIERSRDFDIAYVEFTDQGWFHFRAQWDRAWNLIDQARSGGRDAQVVVFVHGWRHSAAFDDLDVRNFREVVMPAFAAAHPQRRTIGLYIGWRGRSMEFPGIERLSFYDRKFTAERIARGSIRELIGRLRWQHLSSDRHVHLTLIGHSFGGLIVYNAIAESLLDSMFAAGGNGAPRPVVDLAIALNPSFEASRFEPLFQVARRLPASATAANGVPIFVSITSDADSATKSVFPIGRLLNSLFDRESWTDEDECPGGRTRQGDCPGGDSDSMLERITNTSTIGHLDRYLTHRLDADGPGMPIRCRREPKGPMASPGVSFPLWTMRGSARVMDGHHDIYRPALWQLVVALADGKVPPGCESRPSGEGPR